MFPGSTSTDSIFQHDLVHPTVNAIFSTVKHVISTAANTVYSTVDGLSEKYFNFVLCWEDVHRLPWLPSPSDRAVVIMHCWKNKSSTHPLHIQKTTNHATYYGVVFGTFRLCLRTSQQLECQSYQLQRQHRSLPSTLQLLPIHPVLALRAPHANQLHPV